MLAEDRHAPGSAARDPARFRGLDRRRARGHHAAGSYLLAELGCCGPRRGRVGPSPFYRDRALHQVEAGGSAPAACRPRPRLVADQRGRGVRTDAAPSARIAPRSVAGHHQPLPHARGTVDVPRRPHKPGGEHIEPYLTQVRDALLAAARKAGGRGRFPRRSNGATGAATSPSNRDLPDPQRERIVTGAEPRRGRRTTRCWSAGFSDDQGRTRATIVNYACHPTTLAWRAKALSPDYPGEVRTVVESATGSAPCLFLQGNSGDLAPRDNYASDPAVADRNGAILGYAALTTLRRCSRPEPA